MNAKTKLIALGLGIGAILSGCSGVTEVSTGDLAPIVRRDAVPFETHSIPAEILDRLAQHRLVIIGETHLIREHATLMAGLVRDLYTRGFRQILMEWPHFADWLLDDFVRDGGLDPDWAPPPWLNGDMLATIRDFNRTLPAGERIRVRAIDMNLQEYGGARDFNASLRALASQLSGPGPLEPIYRDGYFDPEVHVAKLRSAQAELVAGRNELLAAWGKHWYDTVLEMVEVELASVGIRADRDDHYDRSAREREDVMKDLADRRLQGYRSGTLLNVGGNHAQKERLKGTKQQWLGDYLVHESAAVGGSAFVIAIYPARILSAAGRQQPNGDILSVSPDNGLWRLMNETWPDQSVFLPLDDPVFATGGVPMNFENTIYVCAPKEHYDGLVLLPVVHRVPLP